MDATIITTIYTVQEENIALLYALHQYLTKFEI